MSTPDRHAAARFSAAEKIPRQIKPLAGGIAQEMNRITARCGLAAENAPESPVAASRISVFECAHAAARAQMLPKFCAMGGAVRR
jgi:hypothetical protein